MPSIKHKTMIGIYKITNRINGKSYIGQSVDIKRRITEHRCPNSEGCPSLRLAFKKYGVENFDFEILEECAEERLDEREKYYIKEIHPEYNRTEGGRGVLGRRLSADEKKHLSACGKRQWENMTEEAKARTISHFKRAQVGHPVSSETRQKLREHNLGKKQSAETIEKRSQSMKRKKAAGWRKPYGRGSKKVLCIETNKVFPSVKSVGEWLGLPPARVSAVISGDRAGQKLHGYHFVFVEGVETNPDECRGVGEKSELLSEAQDNNENC